MLLAGLLILSGCASLNSRHLKVGECVRSLGSSTVNKITAVSDFGAIETNTKFQIQDSVKTLTWVYNLQEQEELIRVSCEGF